MSNIVERAQEAIVMLRQERAKRLAGISKLRQPLDYADIERIVPEKAMVRTSADEMFDLLEAHPPRPGSQRVYDALLKGAQTQYVEGYVQACDVLTIAGVQPGAPGIIVES